MRDFSLGQVSGKELKLFLAKKCFWIWLVSCQARISLHCAKLIQTSLEWLIRSMKRATLPQRPHQLNSAAISVSKSSRNTTRSLGRQIFQQCFSLSLSKDQSKTRSLAFKSTWKCYHSITSHLWTAKESFGQTSLPPNWFKSGSKASSQNVGEKSARPWRLLKFSTMCSLWLICARLS